MSVGPIDNIDNENASCPFAISARLITLPREVWASRYLGRKYSTNRLPRFLELPIFKIQNLNT